MVFYKSLDKILEGECVCGKKSTFKYIGSMGKEVDYEIHLYNCKICNDTITYKDIKGYRPNMDILND